MSNQPKKLYQESETNFDDTDEFYGRNDDAEPIKGPISYASRGQQKYIEEEDPEYSHLLDNFPTKQAMNDGSSDEQEIPSELFKDEVDPNVRCFSP